jgi:hypothetical protein
MIHRISTPTPERVADVNTTKQTEEPAPLPVILTRASDQPGLSRFLARLAQWRSERELEKEESVS